MKFYILLLLSIPLAMSLPRPLDKGDGTSIDKSSSFADIYLGDEIGSQDSTLVEGDLSGAPGSVRHTVS